jgi:hypothetical protein
VATNHHPGDHQDALVPGIIGESEGAHAHEASARLVDRVIHARLGNQGAPRRGGLLEAVCPTKRESECCAKPHQPESATLHG